MIAPSRGFVIPFRSPVVRAVLAAFVCLISGGVFADVTGSKNGEEKKKEDKKKPAAFVPEARDGAATFVEGESVQIELTASVGTVKQVEFVIRSQPQNGTLSAVRPHPRESNKGLITYTHRGSGAPFADQFTFACRVDGGPVSAPATIKLKGKKFEPLLLVDDITAMDKVFLGGEGIVRFTVKNAGAAAFEGDFAWAAPWRGPPRITLKPGEKATFAVQFKPDKPGVNRLEMFFQQGVDSSKLPLFGECVRALTVAPGQLVLTLNPDTGAREGVLTISNARPDSVRVGLQPPGRIEGAANELELPGYGKTRLSLRLAPEDVKGFSGELVVTTPEGPEKVGISAVAKPVELQVVAPAEGALLLGAVNAGTQGQGELRVRNVGGMSAIVQAQALTPFIVTPTNQAVRIEPGAEAVFTVLGRGDQTGPVKGEIVLRGGQRELKIPVTMEVKQAEPGVPIITPEPGRATPTVMVAKPPAAAAGGVVVKRTAFEMTMRAFLASSGLQVPADKMNPYLEPVTELAILDQRTDSITIAWKKPSIAPAGWVIELARMARVGEERTYIKVWDPISNWKLVEGGPDKVAVKIHTLPPGAQFEVRIMASDRDGKMSQPGAFTLSTALPEPLSQWFWIILSACVLGIVLFVLLRIRSGEMEMPGFRKSGAVSRT